eukprot:3543703-Rhodomonas_salina.1
MSDSTSSQRLPRKQSGRDICTDGSSNNNQNNDSYCSSKWMVHEAGRRLNVKLEKPVYLRQPKGIEPIIGSGKIMALRKAVYSLGTSGRLWWQTFTQKNKDFGMTSITSDDCVFSVRRGESVLIVAIVVDDVSDDWDLKYYLGVHYTRDGGDVIANQMGYLERVLKRYGMDKCKYAASPMPQKFEIDADKLPERGTQADQDIEEMRSIFKFGKLTVPPAVVET